MTIRHRTTKGMKNKNKLKVLIYYGIFSIAMAYVESAIVVYLRRLYYPNGFTFPLKQIENSVAIIEIGREFSTIVMLVAVALLAYRSFKERFAIFIYCFALWDLFYYFWLKVFLNWPAGFNDWDVLFLIPVPWIAPWIAPAIVSIALTMAAIIILLNPEKFDKYILTRNEWIVEILSAVLILLTFFGNSFNVLKGETPESYNWLLFSIGLITGIVVFLRKLFI